MTWKDILKGHPDEDTPDTLAWQAKQNRLRAEMEQGGSVPDWGNKAIVMEEDKGHAQVVVGQVTNPQGKKIPVYHPNIVLSSEWGSREQGTPSEEDLKEVNRRLAEGN